MGNNGQSANWPISVHIAMLALIVLSIFHMAVFWVYEFKPVLIMLFRDSNQPRRFISLQEDLFDDSYTTRDNHLSNQSETHQFDTYGRDLDYIQSLSDSNRVWTCVEADEGGLVYLNAIARVNSLYYFVTEEAYDPHTDIEVVCDMELDD